MVLFGSAPTTLHYCVLNSMPILSVVAALDFSQGFQQPTYAFIPWPLTKLGFLLCYHLKLL